MVLSRIRVGQLALVFSFVVGGAALLGWAIPASAQVDDHLKCYKVKDPNNFKIGVVDLDGNRFGVEAGCKIKLKARHFCTPVSKAVVDASNAPTLPVDGPTLAGDFVCYKIKCPKPYPADQEVSDQFSNRTLGKLKPQVLCVPALGGPPPTTTTTTTLPGLPNGVPCTGPGQCTSGFCTDGLCCGTACGGFCRSCAINGSEGSCSFFAPGTDPGDECLRYVCDGGGSCFSSCTTHAECDAGFFCFAGICM